MPTCSSICPGFYTVLFLGTNFRYFSCHQTHIKSRPPSAEESLIKIPVQLREKTPTTSTWKLSYGSLHNSKIIKYCIIAVNIIISLGSDYFCFLSIHTWRIKAKAIDVHKLSMCFFKIYCNIWTARELFRSKPQHLLVMHFFCLACIFKS